MTDSRVTPQAAVEAAAKAISGYDETLWLRWRDGAMGQRYMADAKAALAAAVPLLCQPLQDEIDRLKRGYGKELMDAEAELAAALGYVHDDEYGWVTGDHTVVTLAMEARRALDAVREVRVMIAEAQPAGSREYCAGRRDSYSAVDHLLAAALSDRGETT